MPLAAEPSLRRALGLHQVLPVQQPGAALASAGVRRFFVTLLLGAVEDAGLAPRRGTGLTPQATPFARAQARRRATARVLARRWLLGELDGEVVVPLTVACSALGLDPEALADAVRRRSARPLRHPRAIEPARAPLKKRRRGAHAPVSPRASSPASDQPLLLAASLTVARSS